MLRVIKNIDLESSRKQIKGLIKQHSSCPGQDTLKFWISGILYIQLFMNGSIYCGSSIVY